MKICVLGDAKHIDICKEMAVPAMSVEELKKLNKNKKLVKKLAQKYDAFFASQAIIKQIPRILGPGLNKAGEPLGRTHRFADFFGKLIVTLVSVCLPSHVA
jgi:large subunit ribosomal protein L10Ae